MEIEEREEQPQARVPNRSVYNLVYEQTAEDDDENVSHSSRSYLEEDDLPLPQLEDSDSSLWSQCGQCCDCCDTCMRKRKKLPKFKCGWIKNVLYYITINVLMILFFAFVMYMTQVNYYQNPDQPPFKQLKFKENQFPGLALVPSMLNIDYIQTSVIWYAMKGPDSNTNRRHMPYVREISSLLFNQSKACKTAKRCTLNTTEWGPCEAEDYGYGDRKPCLYLKLNRLTLWVPEEYYKDEGLPSNFPNELKSVVDVNAQKIWVHCKGASLYDQEKIGAVKFYPGPYFDTHLFPIQGYPDTNPMIAMQLENLIPGYAVKLVCGMYAGNLNQPEAFHTYVYIRI